MEKVSDSDLTLRPFNISDADDLMKWYSDERVSRFCSLSPFASREAAADHVATTVIPHPWHRAICVSGRAVGSVSVSPFCGNNRCRAEIGYVVGSEHWGRGIATAAVRMAAGAVFAEWAHLERVEAVVDLAIRRRRG
ncbi:N-acetyltransferase [Striga asiatica]|uniref:N-acetyltransferase n=1 Tax=Striga asiatica TaxID=4170 RepID=A0A5A7PPM8_STRAF|nr:N-acetyltransferase [Striga asiatica]